MRAIRVRAVALVAGVVLVTIGAGHAPTAVSPSRAGGAARDRRASGRRGRQADPADHQPVHLRARQRRVPGERPRAERPSRVLHLHDPAPTRARSRRVHRQRRRPATRSTCPTASRRSTPSPTATSASPSPTSPPSPAPPPTGRCDRSSPSGSPTVPTARPPTRDPSGARTSRPSTRRATTPSSTACWRPTAPSWPASSPTSCACRSSPSGHPRSQRLRVASVLPLTATPVLQPDGSRDGRRRRPRPDHDGHRRTRPPARRGDHPQHRPAGPRHADHGGRPRRHGRAGAARAVRLGGRPPDPHHDLRRASTRGRSPMPASTTSCWSSGSRRSRR